MFIKKIRMKDYKRFHDLTIDLGESPKRIIALVGPNGCGKSSVFDAMIYLFRAYSGSFGRGNSKDYTYHSLKQDVSYNYNNIYLEFFEGKFVDIYSKRAKQETHRSIFSFRSSFRYNSNLKVKQTRAMEDITKNMYGASDASDIDQKIEEDYRMLLAKYNRIMNDKDIRPSEASKQVIEDLNKAIKNCLDLEISSLGNIDDNRGTIYLKKSDSSIEFSYNVLSAGEKEVVDILLDLYLRRDSYNDSIYIIDEPELHLNTAIQRMLINEINKMVPSNCQIWIATHSIGFLRALQNELRDISQVINFKKDNMWASQAYILQPEVLSCAEWKSIFSTALDDLSSLVCPKVIIYCEGKAKPNKDKSEGGLDADVYNTIFSRKYPEVLFVSSGGNTELDQRSDIAIAILSKVLPSLKILILKDRDMASGKITDEKDRQLYLKNNPKNHRVLKRFELENYLYDKEILEAYCKKENLTFNVEKYNKIVFDVVNENLKDKTGAIKSCCNIVGSVNAEVFKRNLASCITEEMNIYKELENIIFLNK